LVLERRRQLVQSQTALLHLGTMTRDAMLIEELPEPGLERVEFTCGGSPSISHHDGEGDDQKTEGNSQPTGIAGPCRSQASGEPSEDDPPAERKRWAVSAHEASPPQDGFPAAGVIPDLSRHAVAQFSTLSPVTADRSLSFLTTVQLPR